MDADVEDLDEGKSECARGKCERTGRGQFHGR